MTHVAIDVVWCAVRAAVCATSLNTMPAQMQRDRVEQFQVDFMSQAPVQVSHTGGSDVFVSGFKVIAPIMEEGDGEEETDSDDEPFSPDQDEDEDDDEEEVPPELLRAVRSSMSIVYAFPCLQREWVVCCCPCVIIAKWVSHGLNRCLPV